MQRLGTATAVDTDDQTEATRAAGPDAGDGIFEDYCARWRRPEQLRRTKVSVRGRLPGQVQPIDILAVYPNIEQSLDANRSKDFSTVAARRDGGGFQANSSEPPDKIN
jgi:hypothetical protein